MNHRGQRFADKVVVVTGGGSGLGEAMSLAFAREGGRVAVLDVNGEAAALTAKRLARVGPTRAMSAMSPRWRRPPSGRHRPGTG